MLMTFHWWQYNNNNYNINFVNTLAPNRPIHWWHCEQHQQLHNDNNNIPFANNIDLNSLLCWWGQWCQWPPNDDDNHSSNSATTYLLPPLPQTQPTSTFKMYPVHHNTAQLPLTSNPWPPHNEKQQWLRLPSCHNHQPVCHNWQTCPLTPHQPIITLYPLKWGILTLNPWWNCTPVQFLPCNWLPCQPPWLLFYGLPARAPQRPGHSIPGVPVWWPSIKCLAQ